MRLKHLVAETLGYRLKNKKRSHDFLDTHLKQIFSAYDINTVIDVGANIGQYGLYLKKNGFKGRIISFEPIRETFLKLEEVAKNYPNWDVFNCALGEKEEKKKMHIAGKSGETDFSSFLSPNSRAFEDFSIRSTESLNEILIKVLGNLVDELGIDSKSKIHLKMDTQGYDLNVFKGAGSILNFVVSMQSEISFVPVYDGMPSFVDSLKCFTEKGFKVSGIYPVSRSKDKLYLVESDAILVKG